MSHNLFLFLLRDAFLGKKGYVPIAMSFIYMDDSRNALFSNTWLLESRASHHLTPSEEHMPNAYLYHGLEGITVGNGNTSPISNIISGFLNVNDKCLLIVNDLLYTLRIATNILFVYNLCTNNDVFVKFHFGSFFYQGSKI